jgi:hypothetical protein
LVPVHSTRSRVAGWWTSVRKTANWFSRYSNPIIPREIAFSLAILTCSDPWCFACNDFKPFTRPAWNEFVPFALDTQSVDGAFAPAGFRNVRSCYHC